METRVCKHCKKEKDLIKSNFEMKITSAGNQSFSYRCNHCKNEAKKKWHKENKEEQNKKAREYFQKNKTKILDYNKQWKKDNDEHVKEYNKSKQKEYMQDEEYRKKVTERSKKWKESNPQLAKAYRQKYYTENKEKLKNYTKEWAKNNPDKRKKIASDWNKNNSKYYKVKRETDSFYKLKIYSRSRITTGIRRNGFRKKSKTAELLGCSWEFYKKFIEKQFLEGMNWDNYGEWHIDHKIPLKSAIDENEIYILCHYSNTQPLWAKHNLTKNDDYDPKEKEEYLKWYYENVAK